MKSVVRIVCFTVLVLAAAAGQFVSVEFWPAVFSFSFHYHPDAAWVLGGLTVFALIPILFLFVACAALLSAAWKAKMKRSVVWLSCVSGAMALWMLFTTGGEAPLLWWAIVAPFVAIQVGSAFGLSVALSQNG